jgi:hypothetical protein
MAAKLMNPSRFSFSISSTKSRTEIPLLGEHLQHHRHAHDLSDVRSERHVDHRKSLVTPRPVLDLDAGEIGPPAVRPVARPLSDPRRSVRACRRRSRRLVLSKGR